MKKPKISLGVVVKTGARTLSRCLESVSGIVSEIILVDVRSGEDIGETAGMHEARIVGCDDRGPAQARNTAVENAAGDWLLFLEPWEYVPEGSLALLKKLCRSERPTVHQFLCKKRFSAGELRSYEWIGTKGKLCRDGVRLRGYVPMAEARLFSLKNKNLRFTGNEREVTGFNEKEIDCEFAFHKDICLDWIDSQPAACEDAGDDEKFMEDVERLRGKADRRGEGYDKFARLHPDHVSYASMDIKDFAAVKEGLERGFGNRVLLNYMMDYLYKFGMYDKGLELFESVRERFPDDSGLYNYAGLMHFARKSLDAAEAALVRALDVEDSNVGHVQNTGMLYLVKGAFDKAEEFLRRALTADPSRVRIKKMLAQMAQNRGKKPKLSLCMITRDEERYIGRALNSARNLVDEMIVVDTGSVDATREVAARCGAAVYDEKWDDDFSRARNEALKHARGDYVLFLDADEHIDRKSIIDLMVFVSLLPLENPKAYYLKLNRNADEQVKQMIRLPGQKPNDFKLLIAPNLPGIQFEGSAMEDVDRCLGRLNIPRQFVQEAYIRHDSDNVRERKLRKMSAVRKSLDQSLDPEKYIDGAIYFLSLDRMDEALTWIEKACEAGKDRPWYPLLAVKLARFYGRRNDKERSAALFEALFRGFPRSQPVGFAYGEFLYREGAFKAAVETFDAVASNGNGSELCAEDTEKMAFYRAVSMVETDALERAEKTLAGILKENPSSAKGLAGMAYLAAKGGDLEGCAIETIKLSNCLVENELPEINSIDDLVHRYVVLIEAMKDEKMEEERLVMLKTANVLFEYGIVMQEAGGRT